jgi:hypothetical protein
MSAITNTNIADSNADTVELARTEIQLMDVTGKPYVRRYADRSGDTADMYWPDGVTLRHRYREPYIMSVLALTGNPGRFVRDRILRPALDALWQLVQTLAFVARVRSWWSPAMLAMGHGWQATYLRYRQLRLGWFLARKQSHTERGMTARRLALVKTSRLCFALTFGAVLYAVLAITAGLVTHRGVFLPLWLGIMTSLGLAIIGVVCDLRAEGADAEWVASRLKDIHAKLGGKRDLGEHPDDAGRDFWAYLDRPLGSALPTRRPRAPRRAYVAHNRPDTVAIAGRHRRHDDAETDAEVYGYAAAGVPMS